MLSAVKQREAGVSVAKISCQEKAGRFILRSEEKDAGLASD